MHATGGGFLPFAMGEEVLSLGPGLSNRECVNVTLDKVLGEPFQEPCSPEWLRIRRHHTCMTSGCRQSGSCCEGGPGSSHKMALEPTPRRVQPGHGLPCQPQHHGPAALVYPFFPAPAAYIPFQGYYLHGKLRSCQKEQISGCWPASD